MVIMELDIKDKKILFSIAEDAKKPRNKVAKEVGLSKDIVDYRIKKLLDNDVISVHPRINLSNFIYGEYFLLIQLVNTDVKKENEIIEQLKKLNYVVWIGKIGGDFDIMISFVVKDLEGLAKVVDGLDFIGSNLKKYELYPIIKEYKESFKGMFTEDYFAEKYTMFAEKCDVEIDGVDKQILYLISEDVTKTNRFIAERLKLSEEAVRIRLKNLEKKRIILNYRTFLNADTVGLKEFVLFMNFDKFDTKLDKKLDDFFNTDKDIVFANRLVGKYNVCVSVYAKSINHFYECLNRIRNVFQEQLKDSSFVVVFSTDYICHLPKGLI